MIRRPPRSTQSRSSAASDVYKRCTSNFLPDRTRITSWNRCSRGLAERWMRPLVWMAVHLTFPPPKESSRPLLYVIDYGSGNLRSVQKAFDYLDVCAEVGSDSRRILDADGLVLPGVGAFGAAMRELEQSGLMETIRERVTAGVPFLGICLGMQLLLEGSEEDPDVLGLGIIPGTVRSLPSGVKVPHMGWNQAEIMKDSSVLEGIPDASAFYFVHSYVAVPTRPSDVMTTTDYGVTFASGLESGNVTAFQFHPEKSSALGLRIYSNFARIAHGEDGKG